MAALQSFYYCRKCDKPVLGDFDWIDDDPKLPPRKIPAIKVLPSKKDKSTITGLRLECGHFILASQPSIPTITEDSALPGDRIISTEELAEIRNMENPKIIHMNDAELLAYIQQHHTDYLLHLQLSKKDKYSIQLGERELERRKDDGKLSPQAIIDFTHLSKGEYKKKERLVRETIQASNVQAKKVKSENKALTEMLIAMRAKGKNISMEELKQKLGVE